jgi:hypothetical protein
MREDYIMRLIEQAATMLAQIIAFRKADNIPAAQEKIEANCRERVGLPLEMVRHASPEALTRFLERDGQLRYVDAVMLAELLMQDAEIAENAHRLADALRSREQAYCLLVDSMPVLPLDEAKAYRAKVRTLEGKIREMSSDSYVLNKMEELRKAMAESGISA